MDPSILEAGGGAWLLMKAIPEPLRETGGDIWGIILGDRISAFRERQRKSLNAALDKEVAKIAEEESAPLEPSKVSPGFAFEWAEAATRKEDESLHTLFARLLLRAMTAEGKSDERFIYALRDLTPSDARMFLILYGDDHFRHLTKSRVVGPNHYGDFDNPERLVEAHLCFANLSRAKLVEETPTLENEAYTSNGRSTRRLIAANGYRPSAFGLVMYDLIKEPTPRSQENPDERGGAHPSAWWSAVSL